jgi:hypothetical protein
MFERNRIEAPSTKRDKAVPVELTLDDGRILKGKFYVPTARQIFEELNGNGSFLEFEGYEGVRELIAKTSLRSVRIAEVPNAANLAGRASQTEFDPYAILHVPQGASIEVVREAYHRLSKLYHPDRYANTSLPDEVAGYLDAMSRRVNAAFSALEKPAQIKREINRAKTEPIYQRG